MSHTNSFRVPRNHFFRNLLLKKGNVFLIIYMTQTLRKGRKRLKGIKYVLSSFSHRPHGTKSIQGALHPLSSSSPRSGPRGHRRAVEISGRGSQKWWRLFSALRSSTDCQQIHTQEQQKADRWINRASEGYSLVKGNKSQTCKYKTVHTIHTYMYSVYLYVYILYIKYMYTSNMGIPMPQW